MSINGISRLRPQPPSDRVSAKQLNKKIDELVVDSAEYWEAVAALAQQKTAQP